MKETRRARALVLRHGWNAECYQVLNPGVRHWFAAAGDAVVGYATFGRTRVVVGAPVCAGERLAAVATEFEEAAAAANQRVVFFAAGSRLERLLAPSPNHSVVSLGAHPVWNPQHWPQIVRHRASLRAQCLRARNKGVSVTRWTPARARASRTLRRVLREWLAGRGLPPLHFMVEPELLDSVEDRHVFVAEREAPDGPEVVGFLVAAPIPARAGWLVEQWPRARAAPNGTTHLLVDAAMRDLASGGASYVSLGLAPLSVHGTSPEHVPPPWMRGLLAWMRAHCQRFYNFGGLEAFKASLQPMAWEPAFAIAPGGRFTPSVLRAIAGVFAGGSPEYLVAKAVGNAAIRVTGSRALRRATSGRRAARPSRQTP